MEFFRARVPHSPLGPIQVAAQIRGLHCLQLKLNSLHWTFHGLHYLVVSDIAIVCPAAGTTTSDAGQAETL